MSEGGQPPLHRGEDGWIPERQASSPKALRKEKLPNAALARCRSAASESGTTDERARPGGVGRVELLRTSAGYASSDSGIQPCKTESSIRSYKARQKEKLPNLPNVAPTANIRRVSSDSAPKVSQ